MILKTISHMAGVGAVINLETIANVVAIKNFMHLDHVEAKAVLIADIQANGPVTAQIVNVLADHGEGGIGRPFGLHGGHRFAVLERQIEKKRGIGRVGGMGSDSNSKVKSQNAAVQQLLQRGRTLSAGRHGRPGSTAHHGRKTAGDHDI